ncbi:putative amino acid transporter transmembrane protein s [Streptomyces lincolnensis]|uniref:Putative amino acid transporter transmembrane protein s n=1 Tax=Streptomyces lincolnensis TaxID=1915 RepID=A0A1B1MN74_STRLN|nr:APC family permease [Streptomyces lincolnensis]ANS70061.1 putative amino acid transporter transmembrane protein s [Streptomyces lincolnensis]AXG58958.1 putative amino acid transporter transmembrane protein s [Streptomyces lincolnensis]QMV11562.1 amino acid permease [Streptomyces lincolnensis]
MSINRGRGLQANALGTFDTVVMAVAGSAPAYSLAATTAVLVGAVGLASPAALLYCAIPMLGIALAFSYLGRIDVNAGASYSWVGRTLHPFLGFMSGWALVISTTIFMVAGSLPAGSMTLSLFDEQLAENTALSTAVGAGWFLIMLLVVLGGARLTVRAQFLMSGIELAILALFAVLAVFHTDNARAFDWSWLGFGHFDGMAGFASGALIAAFYYWGWDVTSNLSEETRNSRRTTGLAGLIGVGIVFLLFEAFTIAVNMILSAKQIEENDANVLAVLGEEIWPGWGGKLLVVAVMLSTIATLETTLIQVTRSLFAMGRDRTMPSALGRVHPHWNTPWVAITVVGTVAMVMLVASNALGTVGDILSDAISAIGLQIAVYYGLAGLAAVVAYRRMLLKSVANFVLGGLWPLFGSLFMFWVLVESLGELSTASVTIGLGGLAVGLIPMFWYWMRGSDYYRPARLDAARTIETEYVPDDGALAHSRAHEGFPTDF